MGVILISDISLLKLLLEQSKLIFRHHLSSCLMIVQKHPSFPGTPRYAKVKQCPFIKAAIQTHVVHCTASSAQPFTPTFTMSLTPIIPPPAQH
jgi:hypothetical protein